MQPSKFNLEDYGLAPEDILGRIALIYTRVSGDPQEDNTSKETQEEECRKVANQLGIPVLSVFTDTMTGSVYRERKGLSAMRDEYKALSSRGEKVIIFVYVLDRISRDQVHFAVLIDEMKHHNVILISVKEKFDDSPLGRMTRNLMAFVAEVERAKITDRLLTGRIKRSEREHRMTPGPKATYGYRWDDQEKKNSYIIYEPEAKIVREIFERYARGDSMRSIAFDLAERGVAAPRTQWGQTTIHRILVNKRYRGEARSFYTTRTLADKLAHKGWKYKSDENTILLPDGTIPRLISNELFEQAQERLEANIQDSTRNASQEIDSLLRAGFAVCGYCGNNMRVARKRTYTIMPGGGKKTYVQYYYRCGARAKAPAVCMAGNMSVSKLDNQVWVELEELAQDTKLIEAAIQQVVSKDRFQSEAQSLERSIAEQEAQIEQYTEDLKSPALRGNARTVILSLLSDAQETLEKMNSELAQVKRGTIDYERIKKSYTELLEWCERVQNTGEEMTLTQKRDFLRLIGAQVRVYREDDTEHERYELGIKLPKIATGTSKIMDLK